MTDEFARRREQGIAGLFLAGPAVSMAIILGSFVALFFAFGFWWPYWRSGDMDMWMVYEAFIFNDGLPQEYFDHPGYLTILSLGYYFKLLHNIGLLPVHSLSELPPVTDNAASATAWMHATQAARVLSLLIAIGFVSTFSCLLHRLVRDWRVGVLAAFLLAFSGGLMMEARIVRTELISAFFAFTALLILVLAARQPSRWRALLVGLASMLVTLALLNKIQFIFVVLTLPPIVFAFGWSERQVPPALAPGALAFWVAAAAAALYFAYPILIGGLFDPSAVAKREQIFGIAAPFYQAFVPVWVGLWMLAYAIAHRLSAAETISAIMAAIAGAGLGLLALDLHYDARNAIVVMNPLEQMLAFVPREESGGSLLVALLSGVQLLIARFTFVFSSSPRPTIFLEWIVIAAAVFAWRRGKREAVLQAALLLVAAKGIDFVGALRGLKIEYFLLADPFVILAAAWLLVRVPELRTHRLSYPVGLTLLVATVSVGLAEPVKHTFRTSKPFDFCVPNYPYTKRIESFSFCR